MAKHVNKGHADSLCVHLEGAIICQEHGHKNLAPDGTIFGNFLF